LLVGGALLAFFMVRKARAVLAGCALSWSSSLLPSIFFLQVLTLFTMETAEQLIVFGHILGPAIWLGAPAPISLGIHATVCLAVTFGILRAKRGLAATTLRVIRLVEAIARLTAQNEVPALVRGFEAPCFAVFLPVFCAIGKRAPPHPAN
jgi:hypothetical protein